MTNLKMKIKFLICHLLKGAISAIFLYVVLIYFTDFEKPQLISEYYDVDVGSPNKSFSKYQLLPLEKNDLFYFRSSTNNLWLKSFSIESDTINLLGVNYGGFYIKFFGATQAGLFKFKYDKNISHYKLIELQDQDVRVNSLTSYISWHIFKSLLIILLLFGLLVLFDRLSFKENKGYFRLSITISLMLSIATTMIIYKSLYHTLLFG